MIKSIQIMNNLFFKHLNLIIIKINRLNIFADLVSLRLISNAFHNLGIEFDTDRYCILILILSVASIMRKKFN